MNPNDLPTVYACPLCGARCEVGVGGCEHFDPRDVTWGRDPDGHDLLLAEAEDCERFLREHAALPLAEGRPWADAVTLDAQQASGLADILRDLCGAVRRDA